MVNDGSHPAQYTLQAADDCKLIVMTLAAPSIFVPAGLPLGFTFGMDAGGGVNLGDVSISGLAEHFFDEGGDQTNTYGTTGNVGGDYAEFTKVASGKWQVISKCGTWSAT